jgi:deoxyribose-phosphate aldolase
MAQNTCQFVVGRLLEIRVAAGYRRPDDVHEMIEAIKTRVGTLEPAAKFAIAADWRAVQVMSPETAEQARLMLRTVNPRVTRSAILTLSANPTTNLQVVRLVHEAENVNRKHFTSPKVMHQWVSQVLTQEESQRLSAFLGEAP